MSTSGKVVEETRQGIIFTARVKRSGSSRVVIEIFIEGQEKPVGTMALDGREASVGDNKTLFDQAFQSWLIGGCYLQTIADPSIFSVLDVARLERLVEVAWYRRVYRFLPAEGCSSQNPRFILTSDKSDLSGRERRILKIGEGAFKREEEQREGAKKRQDMEARRLKDDLRDKNAQLILEVAKCAIKDKLVPVADVRKLSALGLLEPSTSFRSEDQFPGEDQFIFYDFIEGEVRYAGCVGFDVELRLISVDERFPKHNQVYLEKESA